MLTFSEDSHFYINPDLVMYAEYVEDEQKMRIKFVNNDIIEYGEISDPKACLEELGLINCKIK